MIPDLRLRGLFATLALQLPWLLVLPLFLTLYLVPTTFVPTESFGAALGRSVGLALLAATICVSMGLLFGWLCRGLFSGLWLVLLPCLLVPVLIGPLSIGFLAKIAVLNAPVVSWLIGSRDQIPTLSFILVLYLFQYAPMCAYVFWLRARTLPCNVDDYARTARLAPIEFAADVFWPHCRSLCQVLFVFVFFLTATEFSLTDLSIRPSVGTSTALLSHWLAEEYRIWMPAGGGLAAASLAAYGIAGALSLIVVGLLANFVFCATLDLIARGRRCLDLAGKLVSGLEARKSILGPSVSLSAVVFCLFPLVLGYIVFPPRAFPGAGALVAAFFWSLPAALASVLVSISIAILLRVSVKNGALLGFDTGSIYLLILNPLAMPTLIISTASFWWFGGNGMVPLLGARSGWLVGQVLVGMPLLVGFCFWLHLRISDRELEYQRSTVLRPMELITTSFLDRLRPEYLLLLLFSWSLVWNDGVVNRGAASEILSLYSIISPKLSVRPDYQAAQFCLMFSLLAAAVMIAGWQRATAKASNS